MRSISLLFFLSLFTTTFGQWQSEAILGVHESVAIFDSNTFGIQEANGSLYTTDGGETFQSYDFVNEEGLSLLGFIPNDLEYIDAQTLICGGWLLNFQQEGILRSTNGGQSWDYVYTYTDLEDTLAVMDITFPTETIGYSVGFDGRILKTFNGGQDWVEISTEEFVVYHQVDFVNANNGVIGTDYGILKTDNGGLDWSTAIETDVPVTGVSYKDENTIMACGYNGLVLYSEDGGETWVESTGPASAQLDVVHYQGNEWVMAGGSMIYRSQDNGQSWYAQTSLLPDATAHALVTNGEVFLARRTSKIEWTSTLDEIPLNKVRVNDISSAAVGCAGPVTLMINVDNEGFNAITSLEFEAFVDGILLDTYYWSGEIPNDANDFDLELTVQIDIDLDGETIEFVVTEINDAANLYSDNISANYNVDVSAYSGTYVIGPNGDYPTIQALVLNTPNDLCGNLILKFEDGVYDGYTIYLDGQEHFLTIEGLNGVSSDVTIVGEMALGSYSELAGVTLRNIHFIDESSTGLNLLYIDDADDVTLENVQITCQPGWANRAVRLVEVNNLTVESCTMQSNDAAILFDNFGDQDSLIVRNSYFFSETGTAFDVDGSMTYVEFEGNTIDVFNFGLDLAGNATYIQIRNNRLRNHNTFTLFRLNSNMSEDDAFAIFENNVFFGGSGPLLSTSGEVVIRNNIFYGEAEFGQNYMLSIGNLSGSPEINAEVSNNIFLARGNQRIFNINNLEYANFNCTFSGNVYFAETDNWFNFEPEWGGDILSQWQEVVGGDENSIAHESDLNLDDWLRPTLSAQNFPFLTLNDPATAPEFDLDGQQRVGSMVSPGAYHIAPAGFDAGIFEIIFEGQCQGDQSFQATIGNLGSETLTNFEVNWSVGGVAQAPYQFTGVLGTFESITLPLGTVSFDEASSVTVEAILTDQNGSNDDNALNDLISIELEIASLNAALTVGEGMNYAGLSEALEALIAQSMCGPTEIIVEPGIYEISNSFSTSNIDDTQFPLVIRSSTGDPDDVTVNLPSGGLWIRNFAHVTVEGIHFISSGDGGLVLENAYQHAEVANCRLNRGAVLRATNAYPNAQLFHVHDCEFVATGPTGVGQQYVAIDDYIIENCSFEISEYTTSNAMSILDCTQFTMRNCFFSYPGRALELKRCQNSLIEGNTFMFSETDAVEYDIEILSGEHYVINNYFQGMTENTGRGLSSFMNPENGTVYVYHNTIKGGQYGFVFGGGNVILRNNILNGSTAGMWVIADYNADELSSDHTVFDIEGDVPAVYYNNVYYSLSEWTDVLGYDTNSIVSSVNYADEAYHADDIGIHGLGLAGLVEFDIEGQERDPEGPDPGCYEMQITSWNFNATLLSLDFSSPLCGDVSDIVATVRNTGATDITSFELLVNYEGEETTLTWEGELLSNEIVEIVLPTLEGSQFESQELIVSLLSINEGSDDDSGDNTIEMLLEGHALKGAVIVGNSGSADFQDLPSLIAHAIEVGICDSTIVLIEPGVYNWNVITDLDLDIPETPFLVRSLIGTPETVVISGNGPVVYINGTHWISFEGITFESVSADPAVEIDFLASENTFTNCRFTSAGEHSVLLDRGKYASFHNCAFEQRVLMVEADFAEFHDCEIFGGMEFTDAQGLVVKGSTIIGNETSGLLNGIDLYDNVSYVNIEENHISGNFYRGIRLDGGCTGCGLHERKFINNIIDHTGEGEAVYLDAIHWDFYHNTVISENSTALQVHHTGFGSTFAFCFNNVLVSQSSFALEPDTGSEVDYEGNVIYSATGTDMPGDLIVSQWCQTCTSLDPIIQPINYQISNTLGTFTASPIDGITLDHFGLLRDPLAPRIGAVETFGIQGGPADFNGDGVVNINDLIDFLGNWGCQEDCGDFDLNGDGVVNSADLLIILIFIGG